MPHLKVGAQKWIVLGPAGCCQNCRALDPMVAIRDGYVTLQCVAASPQLVLQAFDSLAKIATHRLHSHATKQGIPACLELIL